MKMLKFAGLCAVLSVASVAYAQKGVVQTPSSKPAAPTAPPPPPVYIVDPPPERLPIPQPKPTVLPPQGEQLFAFEQKPMAGKPMVLTASQAQAIIKRFKAGYESFGSPRFLISVSRELSATGTGGAEDAQVLPEVERLFGRPLTAAGAKVVDSKTAAAMLAGKPIESVLGGTDPETAGKIADAIIEVVISSKTVTTPEGQSVTIPEIKTKAVRLSDSRILGQAASSNVTNRIPPGTLANYDVRELAEASALALMEQMAP